MNLIEHVWLYAMAVASWDAILYGFTGRNVFVTVKQAAIRRWVTCST